jgi:hypothetical protein
MTRVPALLILVAACASPVQVESLPPQAPGPIERIALVPCQVDAALSTEDSVTTPEQAAGLVTARLLDALRAGGRFDVVPPTEVARALQTASLPPGAAAPDAIVQALRAAFGADAVLLARLRRFSARLGGRQGAHRPAAVRFEVELRSAQGAPLWRGVYDERQHSLSEDLGSLPRAAARGFRFVTAEELVAYGAGEIVRALEDASAAWR